MLPLQPSTSPYVAKAPARLPDVQKTTKPEETPSDHSSSPSPARPPSLESQMIALRVQAALPLAPKTEVSVEEFASFRSFCSEWSKISSNNILWGNFSTYQSFIQTVFNSDIPGILNNFFDQYSRLKDFRGEKREQVPLTNDFVRTFWNLCTVFNLLCERDANNLEDILGNSSDLYRSHYSATIDPHYLILQRFANFVFQLMEKEIELSEDKSRGVLQVGRQERLGFFYNNSGYVPIPFAHNPNDLEVIYLNYSQDVGLSRVFIFDKSRFITSSGFLIEIKKIPFNPITKDTPFVSVRGLFGAETNAQSDEFSNLHDLLDEEVSAFKRNGKLDFDLVFLPFLSNETERNEFAYCFLLDLIEMAKDQNDLTREEAKTRLKEIENLEEMKAEDLLKSLERTIKADFKTQFERQVEKEQRQRTAAVIAGSTPPVHSAGKRRISKGLHKKKEPEKNTEKEAQRFAEHKFRDLQLNGRVRYRRMLKMVGKIVKRNPELFIEENQRGSHHALHMPQGGATFVQPHGRQDNTLSPHAAKKFMKKLISQVHRTLTGQTSE